MGQSFEIREYKALPEKEHDDSISVSLDMQGERCVDEVVDSVRLVCDSK